jgi:hypothetical protein
VAPDLDAAGACGRTDRRRGGSEALDGVVTRRQRGGDGGD